jgi:ABC-2 type transport system ATP-binding protein
MIIEAVHLKRKFGALTAVADLNVSVESGEVFGLVGPDGAGKTTTLRMLCGLIDPTEGNVNVCGYDVARDPDAVKDRIGYMAQRFGLYGDLTVEENMLFYADLFDVTGQDRDDLMKQLLVMTRMEPFRGRPAAKLSGGMKQKLALMCTLLHRPEVLFLDEPTNGVDPVSRRDFWTILRQLVKKGMTVFVTTAYLDEAEHCDRVGFMDHGRLIELDTPDAIKQALPEACYEVHCSGNRLARELLSNAAGVLSADPSGAAVHVFADPQAVSEQSVKQILTSGGLADVNVRRIVPSLEDMFIALIRKESRRVA